MISENASYAKFSQLKNLKPIYSKPSIVVWHQSRVDSKHNFFIYNTCIWFLSWLMRKKSCLLWTVFFIIFQKLAHVPKKTVT